MSEAQLWVAIIGLAFAIAIHIRQDIKTARELALLRKFLEGYIAGVKCRCQWDGEPHE